MCHSLPQRPQGGVITEAGGVNFTSRLPQGQWIQSASGGVTPSPSAPGPPGFAIYNLLDRTTRHAESVCKVPLRNAFLIETPNDWYLFPFQSGSTLMLATRRPFWMQAHIEGYVRPTAPLTFSITVVISTRAEEEVAWIYTWAIVAMVENT